MVSSVDEELRIRLKLMELRRFEEKSEQQANIIKSGQVDLWLQEHHQEMSKIQENLEDRRILISHQAGKLNECGKKKIERVIINEVEVLERELRILKKQTQDNLLLGSKLSEHNSKLRKGLLKEQDALNTLNSNDQFNLEELIDLDFKKNQEQYLKGLERREILNQQISTLNKTIKK